MRMIFLLGVLSLTASGCKASLGATSHSGNLPGVSDERLLIDTDHPVLFLGAEPDAPAIGYASSELMVKLAGESKDGRVPVRVEGPIEVRAHVPEALLSLRVQRRGRVRDTPVYVGPNDRIRVVGAAADPGRLRVVASPQIVGQAPLTFEGTYPAIGVSTQKAPVDAMAPDAGSPHELSPGLELVLCEAPNGKVIATFPPSPLPLDVAVLGKETGWLAVRVGRGPYLVGYTNAALTPKTEMIAAPLSASASKTKEASGVPERLLREHGKLKRIASGTSVLFNDEAIAILHTEGWARVLAEYPNGEVDAFIAVDDRVAVRGLVPKSALREPPASVSGTPSPAATP